MKQTVTVTIRLRRCTRCGHLECPCCRDFCDDCHDDENPEHKCADDLECVYSEPVDEKGYAEIDIATERAFKAGRPPSLTTSEDGQ